MLLAFVGIVAILLIPDFIKGVIYLVKLKRQTKKGKEEIQKRIEESGNICIIKGEGTQ